MSITTGPHNIGPQDLPRNERGRRAWDFVCYAATSCSDKAAAIELALSSADETLADTERLDLIEKLRLRVIPLDDGPWGIQRGMGDLMFPTSSTLRDAIDAATGVT